MYYMKPLKSPTYIHFLAKNFMDSRQFFCIMILWFSPYFICVLCRAKILPQIYIRIIASLKPPPPIYAHYMREKFRPDIYENCGAFEICRWLIVVLVSLRSFVSCFVCAVIVWIRSFLLIDWSMSKFYCKSVMESHKLVVKMWLCICNCICICVCMWCWLWFVIVSIR